ncbi:TRAP transporter small permease [Kushneria aurantia]|uniref:TRAP transporter small permease protein n=1 Tax=Kushneria aurantia TaxID=504092 RepID=A0ABV6FYE6_9GAMM|nr:TRAP transporter small permease [Kushneria aurantia]
MTFRLRKLYDLGAWGAALCMLAICTLVTLQVLARVLDGVLVTLGQSRLGLEISGLSEIAAYLLVGASGLALAYTFVHYAHIRVTLVVSRLPPRVRVWSESICLAIALLLSLVLTWELIVLVRESIEFNDVSSGLLAIPLWIPQTVLIVGVALLAIAIAEALIMTLRTAFREPGRYVPPEQSDAISE